MAACCCIIAPKTASMTAQLHFAALLLAASFLSLCPLAISHSLNLAALSSCLLASKILNYTTLHSDAAVFNSLLDASRQNMRFAEAGVLQPSTLIFPSSVQDVQKTFQCSVKGNWTLRVRSGGHSYEGLSYTANSPFVIIDFYNMRSVKVDLSSKTAWVQTGANLGELYESIAQTTPDYGFTAGICPSVGVGGHFSGGGYGFLSRKYGLAADNVLDAVMVNAKGEVVNRASMGEDLFWALRGGGGGTWGIVVEWKIQLLQVPKRVTHFYLNRFGREKVSELVYRWQFAAPSAPRELESTMYITGGTSGPNQTSGGTAQVLMFGLYLGTVEETVAVFKRGYPEINLTAADCREGRWIDAVARIGGAATPEALMGRYNRDKGKFKAKSDYATKPVPKEAWIRVCSYLEQGPSGAYVYLEPYGGAMAEIAGDAIAFPHRAGNLYVIQYQARWGEAGGDAQQIAWLRRLYKFMAPFVSQSPRAAYVNFIDLDLGIAGQGSGAQQAVAQAEATWGGRYFVQNFRRLVDIKTKVDPLNVFHHPQGIPPL